MIEFLFWFLVVYVISRLLWGDLKKYKPPRNSKTMEELMKDRNENPRL